MEDILNSIVNKLNNSYNGKLNCKEQNADLFVYMNGQEEKIKEIDTEMIYFENNKLNTELLDTDIQVLSYINHVI